MDNITTGSYISDWDALKIQPKVICKNCGGSMFFDPFTCSGFDYEERTVYRCPDCKRKIIMDKFPEIVI